MSRVCFAVLAGLAVSLSAGQQTFRTATDVVLLPVTVLGGGDALVRGLTGDDFEVFEDGQRQIVTFFSEGAAGDAVPLHLGLLLDTSGSMARDLARAATAAIRFVDALDEAVDATFVEFSSDVRVSRFSQASYPHLFERMRSNEADGATALYDAIALYLSAAAQQDGQKVLLLYTDGEDSTSSLSYGRMSEMLRLSDVMVYAVGYLGGLTGSSRGMSQLRLNDLSHQSGGEAFYPMGGDALDDIYARIRDEIASRYTLGYVSTNRVSDGKWRRLDVRTTEPGAKVRTRPGYFAPVR
ncbi:MAG: VWA domain-containing protein [Acidobacteria bacterium]|nr:VWA domain-containing protein [Acidobacteriota bacterium]